MLSHDRVESWAIDYSEHQASRFSARVVGWMERSGAWDAWSRGVAEIGFSLASPGDVSEVITRPEGVFLVRYMEQTPEVAQPFKAVASDLNQMEVKRIKELAEAAFWEALEVKHPVQRLHFPTEVGNESGAGQGNSQSR
jgi:hypothetical protein